MKYKRCTNGGYVRTSSGAAKRCNCDYRQVRFCSGGVADAWFLGSAAPPDGTVFTLNRGPLAGICLTIDYTDPTSTTPGTVYVYPTDIAATYPDCITCLGSNPEYRCTTDWQTSCENRYGSGGTTTFGAVPVQPFLVGGDTRTCTLMPITGRSSNGSTVIMPINTWFNEGRYLGTGDSLYAVYHKVTDICSGTCTGTDTPPAAPIDLCVISSSPSTSGNCLFDCAYATVTWDWSSSTCSFVPAGISTSGTVTVQHDGSEFGPPDTVDTWARFTYTSGTVTYKLLVHLQTLEYCFSINDSSTGENATMYSLDDTLSPDPYPTMTAGGSGYSGSITDAPMTFNDGTDSSNCPATPGTDPPSNVSISVSVDNRGCC